MNHHLSCSSAHRSAHAETRRPRSFQDRCQRRSPVFRRPLASRSSSIARSASSRRAGRSILVHPFGVFSETS
ncbi:hypothetical protein AKJ09_08271 [Labilithrix luteola]|uniref:Uncharacterized protein n=1 Tax=Labilithrix luteola TaxID=1391654 RepID=A0A0K1Q794_9BACT|nr:hypothetical protein AKJ09_08271 [Labilithrix luteola]